MAQDHAALMHQAIALAKENLTGAEGGPFGAVVVRDGQVIGRGRNRVVGTLDPTAHAEILAIREACRHVGHHHLPDTVLYTSCEPCPMCLSAIYWAQIPTVYYGAAKTKPAEIGFGLDVDLHGEIAKPIEARRVRMIQILQADADAAMEAYRGGLY